MGGTENNISFFIIGVFVFDNLKDCKLHNSLKLCECI